MTQHLFSLPHTPLDTTRAPGAAEPMIITSSARADEGLAHAAPHCVVLDTNVALDWLVFNDPTTHAIQQHISAGTWQWCATPSMREELADVLSRPAFQQWDTAEVLARWDDWTQPHTRAHAEPPRGPLICADPDDQVFIDLALHLRAAWLFSRDKALLHLARGAATHGVRVCVPAQAPGGGPSARGKPG